MVSIANNSSSKKTSESNEITSIKLALADSLQTSLDLNETLANFYQVLHPVVACAGMTYAHSRYKLSFKLGSDAHHSASYNLQLKDAKLGKLTIVRTKKFSSNELEKIEALIGLLVYPLRNALLYREALENSLRDPLTQVGNRAAMELTLKRELQLSHRTGEPLSILVLDIDHFKQVNDNAGHHFGDKVICKVAQTITETLRQTDQTFRFGGEEFVVILSGTRHQAAMIIAERIRVAVASGEYKHEGGVEPVTISVGVSSNMEGDTRDELILRGDQALYMAKSQGRNKVISQKALMPSTVETCVKTG